MTPSMIRAVVLVLAVAGLAACSGTAPVGPAGVPSSSNVNPVTGTRGGSGTR